MIILSAEEADALITAASGDQIPTRGCWSRSA
jgi:hypothetical protein